MYIYININIYRVGADRLIEWGVWWVYGVVYGGVYLRGISGHVHRITRMYVYNLTITYIYVHIYV